MELTFTGRGAMLCPSEGNTAAYFEEGNNLFLFDCGEDVAGKLIRDGKLTKDSNVYLFITHTHSDHIGSLGTLQQYLYWICGKKLNIVYDVNLPYFLDVKGIAKNFGLDSSTYNLILERDLDYKFDSFDQIRYMQSNHGPINMTSASIIIKTRQGNILYSGDIADTKIIKYFISISEGFVDKMYIDTSYTDSPVHLSIHELDKVIPDELRNKVYCMHINSPEVVPLIEGYGFNLVSTQGSLDKDSYDLLTQDVDSLSDAELVMLNKELRAKTEKIASTLEKRLLKTPKL